MLPNSLDKDDECFQDNSQYEKITQHITTNHQPGKIEHQRTLYFHNPNSIQICYQVQHNGEIGIEYKDAIYSDSIYLQHLGCLFYLSLTSWQLPESQVLHGTCCNKGFLWVVQYMC